MSEDEGGFRISPLTVPLHCGFALRVSIPICSALALLSRSVNFRLALSRFGVRSAPFSLRPLRHLHPLRYGSVLRVSFHFKLSLALISCSVKTVFPLPAFGRQSLRFPFKRPLRGAPGKSSLCGSLGDSFRFTPAFYFLSV